MGKKQIVEINPLWRPSNMYRSTLALKSDCRFTGCPLSRDITVRA
jgi:hypothetical protein